MGNGCLPQNQMTFSCRICNKNFNDNDHAIQCDIYNFSVHIKGYLHYKTILYHKVALDVQLMNFFI